MFIKKIGRGYYWYSSRREGKKIITVYVRKATKQEIKEHKGEG